MPSWTTQEGRLVSGVLVVGTDLMAMTFHDRGEAHDFVKELGDDRPICVALDENERRDLDQRGAHRAIEELWKANS